MKTKNERKKKKTFFPSLANGLLSGKWSTGLANSSLIEAYNGKRWLPAQLEFKILAAITNACPTHLCGSLGDVSTGAAHPPVTLGGFDVWSAPSYRRNTQNELRRLPRYCPPCVSHAPRGHLSLPRAHCHRAAFFTIFSLFHTLASIYILSTRESILGHCASAFRSLVARPSVVGAPSSIFTSL